MEVFDADAQPSNTSSSSSKAKGPNPAQGPAQAAACEGSQGVDSQSWRGPLLLTRARGGHTRPASAACFMGETFDTGTGGSQGGGGSAGSSGASSKRSAAKGGAPTHVLSGSEDRRLLVWQLPQLGQAQGSGVTEWLASGVSQGGEDVGAQGPDGCGDASPHGDAAGGGGSAQAKQGQPQLLVAEASHGRKMNCVHAVPATSAESPKGTLAFVGDTSRRLACYRLDL